MATGKKSFVLYTDLIHVVRKLPKETRGDLLLIILEYVNDNLDIVQTMEEIDILLSVTFEPVKQQLKRDLKKYEQKQVQRSEAGKRSAELRAVKQTKRTSTVVESRSTNSTVNVNVNDNVNVLSKDNSKPPRKKKQPEALQFPFTGPEFMIAWNKLITLPKWSKKPLSATQQALNNISKYDEEFAINQINLAIAGNWQGLTFPDTDEKYLKWKNGKTSSNYKTNSQNTGIGSDYESRIKIH